MNTGLFGSMFDLNRDGELSASERMMDASLFMKMVNEGEGHFDRKSMLENVGIDTCDFDLMDVSERAEMLEDAGYNCDYSDFN